MSDGSAVPGVAESVPEPTRTAIDARLVVASTPDSLTGAALRIAWRTASRPGESTLWDACVARLASINSTAIMSAVVPAIGSSLHIPAASGAVDLERSRFSAAKAPDFASIIADVSSGPLALCRARLAVRASDMSPMMRSASAI